MSEKSCEFAFVYKVKFVEKVMTRLECSAITQYDLLPRFYISRMGGDIDLKSTPMTFECLCVSYKNFQIENPATQILDGQALNLIFIFENGLVITDLGRLSQETALLNSERYLKNEVPLQYRRITQ